MHDHHERKRNFFILESKELLELYLKIHNQKDFFIDFVVVMQPNNTSAILPTKESVLLSHHNLPYNSSNNVNFIFLFKSHLSRFYREILDFADLVSLQYPGAATFQLVATHLNEVSHIEMLQFHPEYQGCAQSS